MKRSVELGNWLVFIYLITCAILMANGDLSAGLGLGDIAYLLILVGCIVLHLIVIIGIYREKKQTEEINFICSHWGVNNQYNNR